MELSERLAKALGGKWYVKRWQTGAVRALMVKKPDFNLPWEVWDGAEEVTIAGDADRYLPRIDFAIIETILAAIKAKGWYADIRELYDRTWRVEIRGYERVEQQYAAATHPDLPTALALALCAAVEGE